MQKVRVRYAPSPTGMQHIGGLRTALFNYLFARNQGGSFIVRVEDTDQQRSRPEYLDDLRQTLAWAGLEYDEGLDAGGVHAPYLQSQRAQIYQLYAQQLLAGGHAYYCFCSSTQLEDLRRQQEEERSSSRGYDRRCRSLDPTVAAQRAKSEVAVLRFKVPLAGSTLVDDLLLGQVVRENSEINPDPVLLKADGLPTYHLANVVDDHLMQITHVLRAQEWLPSAALHMLLYRAFGWQAPLFCHLPMVLGQDGSKLSKRHGATSVREFRSQGYLPEALVNYVALLGWALDGERQLFSKSELCQHFSLAGVSSSPATFDYQKLDWLNGVYVRALSATELAQRLAPWLVEAGLLSEPEATVERLLPLIPLVQPRMVRLSEAAPLLAYLFIAPETYSLEEVVSRKTDPAKILPLLALVDTLLSQWDWSNAERMEEQARQLAEQEGVKLGQLLQPLRVALTGTKVSPPLFPSMVLLGQQQARERWQRFCDQLRAGCE